MKTALGICFVDIVEAVSRMNRIEFDFFSAATFLATVDSSSS
jgi:hypothetical protein